MTDYCSSDDDSNKDVGYIFLAILGWFILAWTCPDSNDQLCRVVGRILEAILRPLCRVVWSILEPILLVIFGLFVFLAGKMLGSPKINNSTVSGVLFVSPLMWMAYGCGVWLVALLLFVATVLVLTLLWWYRRGGGGGAADDHTAAKRRFPSCD
ncbi:hypothetical protein LINPERHAP1_LOCUS34851 [Linum perenne]